MTISKEQAVLEELRRRAAVAAPGELIASVAELMTAGDCGLATAVRGAARARKEGLIEVVHGPRGGYIAPRQAPQPSAFAARLDALAHRARELQDALCELSNELAALAAGR